RGRQQAHTSERCSGTTRPPSRAPRRELRQASASVSHSRNRAGCFRIGAGDDAYRPARASSRAHSTEGRFELKYVLRPVVIIAVAGVAAAALVFAGSGMAVVGTPLPQTLTDNFHGTQSVVALNQCTNTLVDLTEKTNILFHITSFPTSGDVHVTSTEEDSFSGVDETSGVTYMGHVLFWGTFNLNNQNSNSTFTT